MCHEIIVGKEMGQASLSSFSNLFNQPFSHLHLITLQELRVVLRDHHLILKRNLCLPLFVSCELLIMLESLMTCRGV